MKKLYGLLLFLFFPISGFADLALVAERVAQPPVIDGSVADAAWAQATGVRVRDVVANIDITLKAVHDGERVYLLGQYPDATENRLHRQLLWDPALKSYQDGPTREDCLVLKWSMVPHPTTLTLKENRPYQADIWFWKAHRTDHAGFADDKIQHYTTTRDKKAKMLISSEGNVFYLQREGDAGDPAFQPLLYAGYVREQMPKYELVTPAGSRADIRAKGEWQAGNWTIEFSRQLDTGHHDDVRFELSGRYPFGVSRYEIAGRDPEPDSETPLYGAGEVGELIVLTFSP